METHATGNVTLRARVRKAKQDDEAMAKLGDFMDTLNR